MEIEIDRTEFAAIESDRIPVPHTADLFRLDVPGNLPVWKSAAVNRLKIAIPEVISSLAFRRPEADNVLATGKQYANGEYKEPSQPCGNRSFPYGCEIVRHACFP